MDYLPCPFCGDSAVQKPDVVAPYCRCSRFGCAGSAGWVHGKAWNNRPAQNNAFSQFKSSLDQEYTARTKAEALVKTLEGAIEEILLFLSKSNALPPKVLGQMMDDYENYKKSKEI